MMASSETFKPGLFDIGLNIEKKLSKQDLKVEDKQLKFHLKNKPSYMIPAICNLQAVLSFHMDSGRTDAREILENLIVEYPNDLNVIADLIYLYKKMGRERDSHRYKNQLKSNMNDQLLQARSILAQAYALNYDLTHEHDKTPKVLLKDACRLLKIEDKHLELVDRAINLVSDSYKVLNTIPETVFEKTIDDKELAVIKFEKGIKILEKLNRSKEEIFIWRHNLANARGKLENWRTKRGDDFNSRYKNCVSALETHLDVIENLSPIESLDDPIKVFVARSYIYFAQLYITRKSDIDDNINTPERIKRYGRDLDSMCSKALSICPEDKSVLVRSGQYFSSKNKYLEAVKHYNESIRLFPDIDINWFSYSSRSEAYLSYSIDLRKKKSDGDRINEYLECAYKDAEVSLQSKCTEMCMLRMARICFERAMTNYRPDTHFSCQRREFIHEALEILHETINKREITKYSKIYNDFGMYYPYISEYRKAIQSLKTSLELNGWSEKFPEAFVNLHRCFVAFYLEKKDKNLLSEFRFMLKEAKRRHRSKWVSHAMDMMCQHEPEMLTDLVQNMIEWDVRGCDMLIDEALNQSSSQTQQEPIINCQNLRRQFETKLLERNDPESDINGPTEIQKSQTTETFKYDFFVCHSENDKDWVNWMLRLELEDHDEGKFKGFIPSRDFIPGEHVIDSMIKGIKQSCKLLIVLTPNYIDDNWQRYVGDTMIFSVIETKVEEKTIIPIILEECNIPDKLKIFTPIYFTEESNWERLRRNLRINLDAETGLEERMSALTTCDIDED